jgi:branched-chain amino acid transport system ATP-binding protein
MLLDIKNLRIRYGTVEVVKGVSLNVEEGTIVTLIGANGAGKSTIIKSLSGLIRPYAGEIRFQGKKLDGWKPAKIVKTGIAQVPEGGRVFSKFTVA